MQISQHDLIAIAEDLAGFDADPYGFVMWAFPWGEGELVGHDGPDEWQKDLLQAVGDGLIDAQQAIQLAVSSGHGIGKSALVSWLILWAIATREDTRGVVTANTESQLRTKTWAELAKWHRRCLCGFLFELTATAIYSKDAGHEKTWRIDMVPWSKENTEAFAGLHNQGKRILLLFDEASAIPDSVWETSEGALTDSDTEIIWAAFGNPTRNSGRFKEAFGRYKHRWLTRQIDSRTAKMTNKQQIQQWIDDYGEDSDFVRVRVRGVFPRAASSQFVEQDAVDSCRHYKAEGWEQQPKILVLDVARFGDDQSVASCRQGRRFRVKHKWRGKDTVTLANDFIDLIDREDPDAIVIDGDGIGAGVIDIIRARNYHRKDGKDILLEFHGAAVPQDPTVYFNRRAEVWGLARDALRSGLDIEDDPELESDLTGPEYFFRTKNGHDVIQLESKKDMKARGLSSPDVGDTLAMSFAVKLRDRSSGNRKFGRVSSSSSGGGHGWMGN